MKAVAAAASPGDVVAPSRRAVTSVDLGDLRPRVVALSAAAGVGPSTWLRDLARREIEAGSGVADLDAPAPQPTHGVYRAWLDPELTAALDAVAHRGGFRSRPAALRGILKGVVTGPGAGVPTSDAVRALGISNHHLVALGRNLNQIAKSLHTAPGKTTVAQRLALEDAVQAIRRHLDMAARLVGELRPLLKPARDNKADKP